LGSQALAPNLKRSKVNDAKLLQDCVHVFLIITRSISPAVLILPVILIFLKIQSAMEITKYLTIARLLFYILTMAILNLFILCLNSSSEHLQLLNTCFSWVLPSKYLLLSIFSKPLTVVGSRCAAFLSCQDIIYSPARTKNGCQVSPLLLTFSYCL
jgi:hypothetical protein